MSQLFRKTEIPHFEDLEWYFETNGEIYSSPIISNNSLFVGSNDKCLYAIDIKNGELKWKYKTGNKIWSSPE